MKQVVRFLVGLTFGVAVGALAFVAWRLAGFVLYLVEVAGGF